MLFAASTVNCEFVLRPFQNLVRELQLLIKTLLEKSGLRDTLNTPFQILYQSSFSEAGCKANC